MIALLQDMDAQMRAPLMMRKLIACHKFVRYSLSTLILILLCQESVADVITVMHRAPDSENDKRQEYNTALLKLALEKTLKPGEQIEYKSIPQVSLARARSLLNTNKFPNLVMELTYEDGLTQNSSIDYVAFPIELGALSYRICFVSPEFEASKEKIASMEDLKKKSYATGIGWAESYIFRENQLRVVEVNSYENIFKMLFSNRFDFFCRGASEIYQEYQTFGSQYQLHLDKTFLIHYEIPRFFYLNKSNQDLKRRLESGLTMAFNDGSLRKLWNQHFAESIKFASLKNRQLFELDNHHIHNINRDYKKYLLPLHAYD